MLIWFKSFKWLRIFDNTSFYVGLIYQTLVSIKSFLILILLILLTFGNATTIQSIGRYDPLYSDYFESQFLNTFINQYELSLGEFTIVEKFASGLEGSDPLAWFFFFIATMLSQVMFMNMLIAVMSDTFAHMMESKAKKAL